MRQRDGSERYPFVLSMHYVSDRAFSHGHVGIILPSFGIRCRLTHELLLLGKGADLSIRKILFARQCVLGARASSTYMYYLFVSVRKSGGGRIVYDSERSGKPVTHSRFVIYTYYQFRSKQTSLLICVGGHY